MTEITPDPIAPQGIARFAERLRRGEVTSVEATEAYLRRIEVLEPRLGAFEHVARETALETARAMDRLLAAGTDLGPLMGVPVAIKDLFAVAGMPTTAGSNVDVTDIVGPEGDFVRRLRRAGAIILGKTKTVEFALGAATYSRGTPWNPWDARVHRTPGGSSGGSGVAVAAGLCAFAIGSDTGGSVRIPAAFCGTFGLKTTVGLWPTDGIFPLAPSFDTVGLLTATAADAAFVFAALEGRPPPRPASLGSLRLGRPTTMFFDELDPEVERGIESLMGSLARAGVEIVPVPFPEADEVVRDFPVVSPTELLAVLTRERFLAIRDRMDRDVAARVASALDVPADRYIRLMRRRTELARLTRLSLAGLDALVAPTVKMPPPPHERFAEPAFEHEFHRRIAINTRPGNVLGLCATSTPVHGPESTLPVGCQMICQGFHEERALAIALAVEDAVGPPARPDLRGFLT